MDRDPTESDLSRRRTGGASWYVLASLGCPVFWALYTLWVVNAPHDWSSGESALIGVFAALDLGLAFPAVGVVLGILGVVLNEYRRIAITGIVVNVVSVVVALYLEFERQ